jgi:hypothetical protein
LSLSRFPLSSRLCAGSGLLEEAQYIEYALGFLEKLLEAAWAAVVG